jgi:hypothetical protein
MECLAILDCGGQYTKVIDRKVRELGVKSEIFPGGGAPEKLRGFGGIILSGGPASVGARAPRRTIRAFSTSACRFGICSACICSTSLRRGCRSALRTEYGETEIDCDLSSRSSRRWKARSSRPHEPRRLLRDARGGAFAPWPCPSRSSRASGIGK